MIAMPLTPANRFARTAILGAVLAALSGLGSSALHAQEQGEPTLRVPESWLAQVNDSAVRSQAENPWSSGSGGPAFRIPKDWLAQAKEPAVTRQSNR